MNLEKKCKKHGNLHEGLISVEKTKNGNYLRCRICKSEKDSRSYEKNRTTKINYISKWKRENREYLREWSKKDREKYPEKYKKWAKDTRERMGDLRNIVEISRRRGISPETYFLMHKSQNGLCAICKLPENRKSRTKGKICRLAIDHCHITNKVRDLLCHDCNTGIGKFKDDINLLKKAIMYLEKHIHTQE